MDSAAFRRAREALRGRRLELALASLLGVVQALLTLVALLVAGLTLGLVANRGEAVVRDPFPKDLPRAIASRLPTVHTSADPVLLHDTGLFAVVEANRNSPNRAHRAASAAGLAVLRAVPTLNSNRSALLSLLSIGLTLVLAVTALGALRRSLAAGLAGRLATAHRRQIHRQIYRLGQSALPTQGIGAVVELFTREVGDLRDGLRAQLDHGLHAPALAIGLLLLALFLSWDLTLFLIGLAALMAVAVGPFRRRAELLAEGSARDAAVQLGLLQEDLGLLRTVRVYGMESIDGRRFDEHLERFRLADTRHLQADGDPGAAARLLVGTAAVLALGLLAYNVMTGRFSMAAALLLVVTLAALWRPARDWGRLRRSLRRAERSSAALLDYQQRRPELLQAAGALFLQPLRSRIAFEDVAIAGPNGRPILDGLSLEIPAGSRLAIMGRDEESKQALACLIPRLIDPTRGRVRIDGLDLRDVTLESVRAQVATVLQNDLVFSDSVVANIGLGDPSFGLPRVIEAAKVAHAHHFIQDLPHGYDTFIGPLGHYLRPDEQYRIGLARAFLHDPSIVIIEEPPAALDDDVKHLIDDTIARLAHNRTLIFLPHRLSTLRSCQQVVVLHNGRVEAIGPHARLQTENKLYRHLQYLEFNVFATGELEAGG